MARRRKKPLKRGSLPWLRREARRWADKTPRRNKRAIRGNTTGIVKSKVVSIPLDMMCFDALPLLLREVHRRICAPIAATSTFNAHFNDRMPVDDVARALLRQDDKWRAANPMIVGPAT